MTNSSCVFLCVLIFSGPLMIISCILYDNNTKTPKISLLMLSLSCSLKWWESLLPHWSCWFLRTLRMQLVLWLGSPLLCWPVLECVLHFQVWGTQTLASIVPPDMKEHRGPLKSIKQINLNSWCNKRSIFTWGCGEKLKVLYWSHIQCTVKFDPCI